MIRSWFRLQRILKFTRKLHISNCWGHEKVRMLEQGQEPKKILYQVYLPTYMLFRNNVSAVLTLLEGHFSTASTQWCTVNVSQTVETGCLMIPLLSSPSFLLSDLTQPIFSSWKSLRWIQQSYPWYHSILCHYSLYHPSSLCFHPSQVILSWQLSFMLTKITGDREGAESQPSQICPFWLAVNLLWHHCSGRQRNQTGVQ